MNSIADLLTEAGIIQFGLYVNKLDVAPLKLNMDYLPSYPALLARLAQEAKTTLVGAKLQRLLATHDSIPLGVAISTYTDIPLVWERRTSASELVGAYDIGHPTCLILNSDQDMSFLQSMFDQALRLGLEINHVLFFLKTTDQYNERIPCRWHALVTLDSILDKLVDQGDITFQLAEAVRAYCASSCRHQGSAAP